MAQYPPVEPPSYQEAESDGGFVQPSRAVYYEEDNTAQAVESPAHDLGGDAHPLDYVPPDPPSNHICCDVEVTTCMKIFYGTTIPLGAIAITIAIFFFVFEEVDTLKEFGFFWTGIVLLTGGLLSWTLAGTVLACQCGWDGECCCCC